MVLAKETKEVIDEEVLKFRNDMEQMPYEKIARNMAVKEISKYEDENDSDFGSFPKGAPMHVKAAISYNRLIRHYDLLDKNELIQDGAKIKYVFLRENEFGIPTVAMKGYNDPPEILALIDTFIDYKALFDNEMAKKLESFYSALKWGEIPTRVNQSANKWLVY